MLKVDGYAVFKKIKEKPVEFDEEKHCIMLLDIMANKDKGRMSAFCVLASISERTFYNWLKVNPVFDECYSLGKMYARENWEQSGLELKEEVNMPGTSNCKFEYWRMIGWSRFGVGKNSRIRLDLNASDTPDKHYSQLIKQASEGDFTAGEIKQLVEAVNVGLNTHQVFAMQKEIDALKADIELLSENTRGDNTSAD